MNIRNVLDRVTSFIIDPSHSSRKPINQGIAWAITIILGIGTIGIAHGLSALWRRLRRTQATDQHKKVSQLFQKTTNQAEISVSTKIKPIDEEFTKNQSIDEQRKAHNTAKNYLMEQAKNMKADVFFVSPACVHPCPKVAKVEIKKNLDSTIFTWENTKGVQGDIQRDGKLENQVVLYGVASQFNSSEASSRFTPIPGDAVQTYKSDKTQGPAAQLQFPNHQVEIINDAANLGFNGLCQMLDETTKTAVQHGYFTPQTKESAESIIEQLKQQGDKIEFLCIGNIPKGTKNTQKVYEMLVSAPAFGVYAANSSVTDDQKKDLEFLCALYAYRAQFQQAIQLATRNPKKQVIFKPTAPGLGVYRNRVENVAKGFYIAAKEYEQQLKDKNIQVRLQIFQGQGPAKTMADILGLVEEKV